MALSADGGTILIGGQYGTGTSLYCGVFQISPPGTAVRPVIEARLRRPQLQVKHKLVGRRTPSPYDREA